MTKTAKNSFALIAVFQYRVKFEHFLFSIRSLIYLPAFIFIFHFTAQSQRQKHLVDSLRVLFSTVKEDTSKMNVLVKMLAEYSTFKPAEGLTYFDTAFKLAAKTNRKIDLARVNDKIGRLYWQTGKFSEAYKYHFAALDIYEAEGDKQARNYVLVEIGQDYLNDTKYDEAKNYLLKALKLSEESGDKPNMAQAYDKLTAVYEDQGNYVEASRAAFANLKVSEEMGDKTGIAYATSSVASKFQTLGNNAEALKYYTRSFQLGIEVDDKLVQTYACIAIGEIHLSTGDFIAAENNYKEGLRIANTMESPWLVLVMLYRGIAEVALSEAKFKDALNYFLITARELKAGGGNHSLATVYSKIGIVYTELGKFDVARKYFDSSWLLCKSLNMSTSLGDYYAGIHLLDSATGKWKEPYKNFKEYTIIKDSTFNRETLRKMLTAQMQYENEKKEASISSEQEKKDIQVQEEIKRQRNIRNSAIAVLALMLIFSVIVYRQRNKIAGEKERSDQLLTDKELLLREIHHRVKNNLEVVSSLLALQSAQIDDPNTKEAMLDGQNRVHSIGIVHQKLYMGENLGTIEMKDYFINLSESILDSFGAEGRVIVEFAMEEINVDIDTAVPLGLIVNELLTNTLKYAFPEKQRGKVRIKLEQQSGNILHLEVSDNGIGKSGVTHGTGFGGQLISLLTRQLNGSMKEENKNGTSIFFDFKLEKSA
jgi:two-component system, sensor histidine kinase PdtaS